MSTRLLISLAAGMQALSLVDSAEPSARRYWRETMGLKQFADDPRGIKEIFASLTQQQERVLP